MDLRIATFNMENLFTRPRAMMEGAGQNGQRAIDDHAELNALVARDVYGPAEQARLLKLEKRYGFAELNAPANALVVLNKVRGQLYKRGKNGQKTVVATGRADWTGWFELRTDDVRWTATYNTARVIAESNADVQICIEVENRPTLVRFNEQVLGAEFGVAYPHVMVIDGNDQRGIDVGILSRYPLSGVRSHVDDRLPGGGPVFSRDCPEYVLDLPGGRRLVVMPNHFKSKRGGDDATVQARRLVQATAAAAIARDALAISDLVLLGGDLNDTPDSETLAPLWAGGFADVQGHPSYPTDRPGTFGTGTAGNKIDYLVMSPALGRGLVQAGIERRGSYHPNTWTAFDTVKKAADEASDHHLVWADFSL